MRECADIIANYTILTTQPNAIMPPIHDRMPVIIGDAEIDAWLAPETSLDSVDAMSMPCPANGWPCRLQLAEQPPTSASAGARVAQRARAGRVI